MSKPTNINIFNQTKNIMIAEKGVGAYTFFRRAVGLLNHYELTDDSGLHIQPARKIHTQGMNFPIDIIMLDKNGIIIKLFENVLPTSAKNKKIYDGGRNAYSCVELPANTIKKSRSELGDMINIVTCPVYREKEKEQELQFK